MPTVRVSRKNRTLKRKTIRVKRKIRPQGTPRSGNRLA